TTNVLSAPLLGCFLFLPQGDIDCRCAACPVIQALHPLPATRDVVGLTCALASLSLLHRDSIITLRL
ncbi:hypothetical protein B0I35DRAFT_437630, partial [Stachybotrys elegans]